MPASVLEDSVSTPSPPTAPAPIGRSGFGASVPTGSKGEMVKEFHADLGILRELWDYRELFFYLAWRDVKIRYKQTAFGVLWALLQPFLTMVMFVLLFSRLANLSTDGVPSPLFYFSALLPWLYFAATVNSAGMSLVGNATLLTKIYFPRIILPAAAALSGLLDFAVSLVLLVALMVFYQVPPSAALLLWPVLVVLLVILALGVGMFLAALNVKYRDVKYAIAFGLQLLMFATPLIYPTSLLPERFRWLLALNPLTGLIEAFRHSLIPGLAIPWDALVVSAVLSLTIFVSALVFFRHAEDEFADII